MLEGLVAWVLRTYIGEYVENLNTDQLSVGIYQGQVELENLPLRKDALNNLDLPIEVKSGFIGKVQLSIPWNKLNSAPWVITLEKLYLVAGPVKERKYNEENEKQLQEKRKQDQLQALEEKWKVQKNLAPQGGATWWSYTASSFASMATNVVENLQLNVKDVHLRYEDDVTIPSCSFACGVTITSLSAQSTDSDWIPKFVSRVKADLMYKLADLQNFAVYWDTNAEVLGPLTGQELENALKKETYKHQVSGQQLNHQYILEPVSAQAKMKRNTSHLPLRNSNTPRIDLDIKLETIPFELAEDQFRGMVAWSREFTRFEKARQHRQWRPPASIKANLFFPLLSSSPSAWWRFCIGVHLLRIRDRNRCRTKEFLLQRAINNVKYVAAYKDHLQRGPQMDMILKTHMENCEASLGFEELRILREVAMEQVARDEAAVQKLKGESVAKLPEESPLVAPPHGHTPEPGAPTQNQGMFRSWFPGWGGWYTGVAPATPEEAPPVVPEGAGFNVTENTITDEDALLMDREIEQEIFNVVADSAENNTLLKRDTVFARINFCLEGANFRLLGATPTPTESTHEDKRVSLLELDCSSINMQFESRPRTNGMKFVANVGGLHLRDKFTKDSIMPVLVAPQMKDKTQTRQTLSGLLGMGRGTAPLASLFGAPAATSQADHTLFEFLFEKKPQQSKSDYKLAIKSKPLEIVYNPQAMQRLKEFFNTRSIRSDHDTEDLASARYEEIKRNTQAEFQQALGRFLEGDEQIKAKRWDIEVDIAAPQLIVPESFSDTASTLVVVDLGHLTFNNMTAGILQRQRTTDTNEDDDDFVTPDSTPPNESAVSASDDITPSASQTDFMTSQQQKLSELVSEMSELDVREKIYDKYHLSLSDLQVMIGTARDNWKHAQSKGTSKLHVLDKFSIKLVMERRLLYTRDPQWPRATLAGTLPALVMHVSEHKVQALKTCVDVFSAYAPTDSKEPEPKSDEPKSSGADLNKSVYSALLGQRSNSQMGGDSEATPKHWERERLEDSILLLMNFSINQLSLEIQSRGRSVAELQVAEVSATMTSKPRNTSLSFAVHSLLVVDALQTFGTDFELLVASHKNLWIDSCSGSIRDSGANSPCSPYSPDQARSPVSPGSPAEPARAPTKQASFSGIQHAITSKLQGLVTSTPGFAHSGVSPDSSFNASARPSFLNVEEIEVGHQSFLPTADSEALIRLDLDIISPQSQAKGKQEDTLHIAALQFNNLDFVANQQTITELLGFLKNVLPSSSPPNRKANSTEDSDETENSTETAESDSSGLIKWEVTAEFHRLNVLLMRVEEHGLRGPSARKVATATMLDARIEAHVGTAEEIKLNGFLSGLQFLDLTPEGKRHQKIISVGQDPNMSAVQYNLLNLSKPDMFKTAMGESMMYEPQLDRALTFEFHTPGGGGVTDESPACTPMYEASPESSMCGDPASTSLVLRMASLFYTHAPLFLKELSLCINDFTGYLEQVGDSIKSAATEVAMGFVQPKSDTNTSINISVVNSDSASPHRKNLLSTVEEKDETLNDAQCSPEGAPSLLDLMLDIQLQTPIIMLPRAPDSTQVLVGHLGKISVQNFNADNIGKTPGAFGSLENIVDESKDKLHVNIRDISVYSIDIAKQVTSSHSDTLNGNSATFSKSFHNSSTMNASYTDPNIGKAIVHDTGVSFTIQKSDIVCGSMQEETTENKDEDTFKMDDVQPPKTSNVDGEKGTQIYIEGRVVTPLKVELSKQVFEQLKDTLDNIAPPDDDEMPPSSPLSFTAGGHSLGEEADEVLSNATNENIDTTAGGIPTMRDRTSSEIPAMSSNNKQTPLIICVDFHLPSLTVTMTGNVGDGEQGLVELQLKDFKVGFERPDSFIKDIELSLQSLVMTDLLQGENSRHRHLMVSHSSDSLSNAAGPHMFLSSSCPSSMVDLPTLDGPPSLPNCLHKDNVWDSVYDASVQQRGRGVPMATGTSSYSGAAGQAGNRLLARNFPSTPPPSPYRSRSTSKTSLASEAQPKQSESDRLMFIKVKLVDKKCPELKDKYNNTQRFVDVDFNRLETTLNLQTWVVLLDFLGLGAKAHDPEQFSANSQRARRRSGRQRQPSGPVIKEEANNEVKLKIQSLTLVLNKPEYELAQATVANFSADVSMRDGNLSIRGQLGSMSLRDSSPYGELYRERFMTTGAHALDFDIFKYGLPDPDNRRSCDVSFKLTMSSVWYVHTQRFIMEILAFALNFNQLQDVLGRMRAASEGKKVQEKAFRSARILLDIEAGAPVVLIPHSSRTTDVLVIDMGKLSVHNSFKHDQEPGTVSYQENKLREERLEEEGRSRAGTSDTLIADDQPSQEATHPEKPPFFMPTPGQPVQLDPMSSSVYGSLNMDTRAQELMTSVDALEDAHIERTVGFKSFASSMGSAGQGLSTSPIGSPTGVYLRSASNTSSEGTHEAVTPKKRNKSGNDTSSKKTSSLPVPEGSLRRRSRSGDSAYSRSSSANLAQQDSTTSEPTDPENHVCFMDVIEIIFSEIDLFSAEWRPKEEQGIFVPTEGDLRFPSYVIRRDRGKLLREKGRLVVQVERNLEGEISHAVPDFLIDARLSRVHALIDVQQYKLVKGLLFHNIGEDLEQFETKLINFEDPQIQTVLSGEAWVSKCLILHLENVTLDLLTNHETPETPEKSLARIDFRSSRLTFDSYSDGSKDIDLVSLQISIYDTRFTDAPVNVKPNVFDKILHPSTEISHPNALQLELHFRSTKTQQRFTVLLNNMRIMGVFDWLLAAKDYIAAPVEDPWKKKRDENEDELEPAIPSAPDRPNPLIVSNTGVLTKRISREDTQEPPFEFCMNITDSELVLVEDTADKDTHAVILKMTAILTYKPDSADKPLNCNLQSLEVFSCSLHAEDETALSIIDPMSLNIELNNGPSAQQREARPVGLLDATPARKPPVLEINFQALNIRVSYNDMRLFLAIVNSMPKQLTHAQQQGRPANLPPPEPTFDPIKVKKLQGMGFSRADCERALEATNGSIADSGLWLTQHATLQRDSPQATSEESEEDAGPISGVEVRAANISLCLIDDCLDADVPLVEFSVPALHLSHRLDARRQGKLDVRVQSDYYNRALSGWEPCLEKWRCHVTWKRDPEEGTTAFNLTSADVLNVNLTQILMQQYLDTQRRWTDDFTRDQLVDKHASKRRVPFVPFAIRNQTGCDIQFAVTVTTPHKFGFAGDGISRERRDQSEWKTVRTGDELPFLVEEREKSRHKNTHELKVRQVVVAVVGWQQVAPVSLDKVGVYFREAMPLALKDSSLYQEMPPARVVFDVAMEGTARKVITVRSALMIDNQLDEPLGLRLENERAMIAIAQRHSMQVPAHTRVPVPLTYVHSRIFCRPMNWSLDWCAKPILWSHVLKPGEVNNSIRSCNTISGDKDSYRFCVAVYRQHFPVRASVTGTSHHGIVYEQPGHIITIMPPLTIENLLPIDMLFYLKGSDIRSTVKPGKKKSVVSADLSHAFELGINLENFHLCRELVIPPDVLDYRVKLCVYDTRDRMLELVVHILAGLGGALKLSILAPYWLVNKSGLPLVFRQDGAEEAAGQFEEHEVARSRSPLLFSYAEKECKDKCNMRLGKHWKGDLHRARWCDRFSLERDCGVRPVHVMSRDQRPDWVYNIGIDVRQGRGRYSDTNIVTFSPRYQVDNRSSHKLFFAQRHLAIRGHNPQGSEHLSALPSCTVPFHWPRVDLDQLLSVCMVDVPDSTWSGGFRIDQVDSFHINMRKDNGDCLFLRVDVLLQGATFYVVITDANQMPPPYRIDNFSEVALQYFQTKCTDELLRASIKPRSSLAYAWDEPTLPPHLTLSVSGQGSSATYNMDVVRDGEQLFYENFIYIAFKTTFSKSSEASGHALQWQGSQAHTQDLVLEVLAHNNKIVLKKKEPGNRYQLWRMTSTGMLQHEGTCPPRDSRQDPRKSGARNATVFVLDVADIALQPGRDTGLMLRRPDDRRRSTQLWQFTEDGRLCCATSRRLCVQVRDQGYLTLGAEAFLGPSPPVMKPRDVPPHMQVVRQRLRPGSGLLSVHVITDGPTRVLQVTDIKQQQYMEEDQESHEDWIVVEERRRRPELDNRPTAAPSMANNIEVSVVLQQGVGLSVVNSMQEELMYLSLRGIEVTYSGAPQGGHVVDLSVKDITLNNQLFGTLRPIALCVRPNKHDTEAASQPALHVDCHKMPSENWHAHIFRHLLVHVKPLVLQVEERLLLKLLQFSGVGEAESDLSNLDESTFDTQRALAATTSLQLKRYYFSTLKIHEISLNLSMYTASDLPKDLAKVKKNAMRWPLVRFEDANCDLDPFTRVHLFETMGLLIDSLSIHYTQEMKSQAANILGSVDFLGNPLGLFNDVTQGVYGLLNDGNVGGLVKNLTHGTFNSASKVTGTLSDGLGILAQDTHHQRKRQNIKDRADDGSHMVAAVKGFGHGLVGGLTSIPWQTYSGVKKDGFEGLFTGLFKGTVGMVTKPVAGALDFVSGAAGAVSHGSKGSARKQPPRTRFPRCSTGPAGLLQQYSAKSAAWQDYLFSINHNDSSEMFIKLEELRENLRALISSTGMYLIGKEGGRRVVLQQYQYDEMFSCHCVPRDGKHYVELVMKHRTEYGSTPSDFKMRPWILCDSEATAQRVVQQINYAKNLYEERRNTLPPDSQ